MAWSEGAQGVRPQVLHWRTAGGQEVDLVVEYEGRLLAIELKASGRVSPADARHLRAFREEYGDAVQGALLLHDGDECFRLEGGIVVAPWWRVI